jgi:hypothetical protein
MQKRKFVNKDTEYTISFDLRTIDKIESMIKKSIFLINEVDENGEAMPPKMTDIMRIIYCGISNHSPLTYEDFLSRFEFHELFILWQEEIQDIFAESLNMQYLVDYHNSKKK